MRRLSWILLLAACGTTTGTASAAPDLERYLAASPGRAIEGTYHGADGKELGFLGYRNARRLSDTALIYLHGIESHAGWFRFAAERLTAIGYDTYCLDRRGSGINRENRGFLSGHVDSYKTLIADVEPFVRAVRARYGQVFLVGLSWGGKLAAGYALEHPDSIDGVVLITPGLKALVDVSLYKKAKILVSQVTGGRTRIKTPIEVEMFTTTPRWVRFIRKDPLRLHEVTARFLLQSEKLEKRVERGMKKNHVPLLLFLAGRDRIIDNAAVRTLVESSAGPVKTVVYEDQTHSIQFDAPDRLVRDMNRWLRAR